MPKQSAVWNESGRGVCVRFNAVLESNENGQVELTFPEVFPMAIDGLPELKMVHPMTGERREFTDDEARELETALDAFSDAMLLKALKPFINQRKR